MGEIINGIPKPYSQELKFVTIKSQIDTSALNKDLNLNPEKYDVLDANIDHSIFNNDFRIRGVLEGNDFRNTNLLITNKKLIEDKRPDVDIREIWKFNNKGELITKLTDLPQNNNSGYVRDMVIDTNENIYYLVVNRDGAELIKWYK